MAAARVPGDLIDRDPGEQPEGGGTGTGLATGASWHAHKGNEEMA